MINNYLKYFLIFSVFVLNSCETLQDFAGLNKPDLEIDLFEETPELVLPPDFGKVAKRSKYRNEKLSIKRQILMIIFSNHNIKASNPV